MPERKNSCIIELSETSDSSLSCSIRFSPSARMRKGESNPVAHHLGLRLFRVLAALGREDGFDRELDALLRKFDEPCDAEGGAA